MGARSSSPGLSSRAGRARRCGSARDRPRPAPSRRCPSPPGSAARVGARWQRRERCASSRSDLSGGLHQGGSRGMQLHAHPRRSYYFIIGSFEGAWVFEAIPVLSSVECELVRQTVHALRSSWIARGSADYPFYTVGAASYIDAVPGTTPPRYSEILVETNPVLREHFHWLYARLMNNLSVHLPRAVPPR